jgi:hypothetical protein
VYCEVKNKKHNFGSSTDYGMNVITGSRTGIKMETSKEPSLLDIFTSWKDWDNEVVSESLNESVQEEIKLDISMETKSSETSKSTAADSIPKTPGQIALDNMKLKAAELLASQKKGT